MKNNILLTKLIESLIKEETDKALKLSNKRRKKFKKQFQSLSEASPMENPSKPPLDPSASSPVAPTATPGITSPVATTAPGETPGGVDGGIDIGGGSEKTTNPTDQNNPDPTEKPDSSETPKSPMDDITTTAKTVSAQTKNVSDVVKSVKAKIQQHGNTVNPQEVLKALETSDDFVVRQASSRIKQFFNTSSK